MNALLYVDRAAGLRAALGSHRWKRMIVLILTLVCAPRHCEHESPQLRDTDTSESRDGGAIWTLNGTCDPEALDFHSSVEAGCRASRQPLGPICALGMRPVRLRSHLFRAPVVRRERTALVGPQNGRFSHASSTVKRVLCHSKWTGALDHILKSRTLPGHP